MTTKHKKATAADQPVWFITGCSTGFGRELANHVLECGYRVVVTARQSVPKFGFHLMPRGAGLRSVSPVAWPTQPDKEKT